MTSHCDESTAFNCRCLIQEILRFDLPLVWRWNSFHQAFGLPGGLAGGLALGLAVAVAVVIPAAAAGFALAAFLTGAGAGARTMFGKTTPSPSANSECYGLFPFR